MMSVKEMEKEINDYVVGLILKSNFEDWNNMEMAIKNIHIFMMDNLSSKFIVKIHDKNNNFNKQIDLKTNFCWDKEKRRQRKQVKQKHSELLNFYKNKKEYEKTLETYNLLPVNEIRKKKLENINKNE